MIHLAIFDRFFFYNDKNEIAGISLGHSGREHMASGINRLKEITGVSGVMGTKGVEHMLTNPSQENLGKFAFIEFKARVAAPLGSKQKTKIIPSARLVIGDFIDSLANCGTLDKEGIKLKSRYLSDQADKPSPVFFKEGNVNGVPTDPPLNLVRSDALVATFWEENSLCIEVWGEKRVNSLKEIYESVLSGRCALTLLTERNGFPGLGLCLSLIDKLSTKQKMALFLADAQLKAA